jgi:hypothetical protein
MVKLRKVHIKIQFVPGVWWIGIYYTKSDFPIHRIFICVLPMLPIRISWWDKSTW